MLVTVPNNSSSVRNGTVAPITSRPSKSGLSSGAICAIAIPTIAALLGVAAVAAFFSGAGAAAGAAAPAFTAPSLPEPTYIDTSLAKFNIPNEIPVQQPQPIQIIQQPQPQPIQVQTVKEVPRVDYQVNRVIEPKVNIAPQQVQMVPIQEVQMVPVQEVEMVPVEQVELVPVQQMGGIQAVNGVQQMGGIQGFNGLQQIGQMNQVAQMGQPAGVVPQGQLGNQIISSSSQFMSQNPGVQYLPSQYL